ncbi:tyrosine-protein phosphatase non-receptor type substrate 1-like isoform X2 [Trichosurus vulpecula]|uniref:tyrosine-protein phosphatase non-receptor type substrate 1-like isoform X2 n=1 Tax=Trichosurus vulpecula TaxID=9337 RepID=UPI00186B075B|nr:tyrosine-protein phosphatase non-receptor type substrate 1-like isoform X2 [Trichosurus vulpecula]
MDPSPVLVSLGSDVLLQCIFPAVGKDMPTPTVSWHHGQWRLAEYDGILVTQRPGTELPESAEGLRKGNASLLLHRVAMADLGSYYCTVTVGKQQAEAGVLLEISGSDLQIYTEPSSSVTMGSSALLKCRFSIGDVIQLSSLTIRWYAPGGQIVAQFPPKEEEEEDVGKGSGGLTTLGSFSEAELLLGNASLTILRAQPKDAGLYSCSVGYGAAPHISLLPVQVSLGEKTTLLCQIKGFYPAGGLQAWWLRNGQKLPEAIPMGSPTQNPDGTFDLELILNLTLESHDLEANFTCHVTHPALEHPLQQILEMEVKEEKWWEDVQSNTRPSLSSILITTLGITVLGFAIIYSLRRNRGLVEEEQEQGEFRTAADGEDRKQPQEKSDFQSPGRNWEVEKLLPREHTESEEEILQGNRKAGFLQGYRKTVGVMEVRYARIEREITVECRKTEDKILVLEGGREGQVLVETGESKEQNLEGYGESERQVLEEVEVSTETQFQEADAIRTEGQIVKGNGETEDHKRDKEATGGQTQGGDAEGQTRGGDAEGQTQGGDAEGQTQGGDAEGQTQGGDAEGQTQGGDAEGQTRGRDAEGQTQGGDAEGQTRGGDAEGQTQGGDAEGQTQGGDAEGQTQGGDAKAQVHRGDEEATEGHVSKEVGGNEIRPIGGEGEAMEQIPSGYEGIEGWASSGKIDTQPLRTNEDVSEQSPGAVGDIGSSPRRRHHLAPATDGEVGGGGGGQKVSRQK